MIHSDTVVSLGSFSKILAPGLRLGWIQAGPRLRDRLLRSGLLSSGGSVSHYSSHIVRSALDLGLQAHLEDLRRRFRTRLEAMEDALQAEFGQTASWRRPEGGYHFWIRLDDGVDTTLHREEARRRGAGFQPGSLFSCHGRLRNFLRLSFAHFGEDEIREGVARCRQSLA
jgi:2-aminoadipate transaminase